MRALLFSVHAIAAEGDRLYVAGRCCGDLVRINDEFSSVLQEPSASSGSGRSVTFMITAILAYQKYLNQIDPGQTSELELKSRLGVCPVHGEWLAGESSLAPFEDVEILGEGNFHVPLK